MRAECGTAFKSKIIKALLNKGHVLAAVGAGGVKGTGIEKF
jgi:carbamate kinase